MDEQVRRMVRSARAEAERAIDVDEAWRELTARIAADTAAAEPSRQPAPRRRAVLLAAAASVAVIAAIGYALTRPDSIRSVDSPPAPGATSVPHATSPVVTSEATLPSTVAPATVEPTPSTVAHTIAPPPDDTPAISIAYQELPPEAPFAFIWTQESQPDQTLTPAVGDLGIALVGDESVTVISWDGTSREIAIQVEIESPLYGPGDVLYGVDVDRAEMVAVALSGPRAGEAVTTASLPDEPGTPSTEVAPNSFVHGPDGIDDVARATGGPPWIGYVDVLGTPISWPGQPLATPVVLERHPVDGAAPDDGALLRLGDLAVRLHIERHPEWAAPPRYPPAGRGPDGAALYPVDLGPSIDRFGLARDSGSAVAVVQPDGTTFWSSLGDGWTFAASSPWGALVRFGDDHSGTITWATLDLRHLIDPSELPATDSGIASGCTDDAFSCTRVATTPDGVPVTFDDATGTLVVHREPPVVAQVDAGEFASIAAVGPDDTVYVESLPSDAVDPIGDVVAISMASSNPGRIVRRWDGTSDFSGDSDLVSTPSGIVVVGCCGPDTVRPEPDASIEYPWLDRDGNEVTLDAPVTRWNTETRVVTVGDRTWTLDLAELTGLRGMPTIVPTTDGGFVGAFHSFDSGFVTLARGWPEGHADQVDMAGFPVLLTPDGRVWFEREGRYVVTDPFSGVPPG